MTKQITERLIESVNAEVPEQVEELSDLEMSLVGGAGPPGIGDR